MELFRRIDSITDETYTAILNSLSDCFLVFLLPPHHFWGSFCGYGPTILIPNLRADMDLGQYLAERIDTARLRKPAAIKTQSTLFNSRTKSEAMKGITYSFIVMFQDFIKIVIVEQLQLILQNGIT